ncbi:T-cell receptor-associated transmembrane adapter 1 isoform X2 [Amia ocellicauda]|uniref:T-cell receptor-associated transmembrane adapter 1 isoform X2 n=1 Tax=Amia ocellicauda TaxID=2972642 RepID=UPI003464A1C5
MGECTSLWVGLAITAIALLISVCLNVIFYRQRKDSQEIIYPEYVPRRNSFTEIHLTDENPIYGNINQDIQASDEYGFDEVCYEQMKAPRHQQRQRKVAPDQNMCYASLDLTVEKKKRKKRKKQQQTSQELLDVETEGHLPSRSCSIYLNSQQLVEEDEEAIHDDPARIFSMLNKSQTLTTDSV